MALPQGAPNNLQPAEPELTDAFNLHRKEIFLGLNCHAVGQIQSFNPALQTAIVTISYTKVFSIADPVTGTYSNKSVNYPILADCPVVTMGGGNGLLTFPIAPGDPCIVMFNDRDIDNWYAGSTSSPPNSPRLHSMSDGIILVGPRNLTNVVVNYNGSDIELRTKTGLTKIAISGDGTKITASVGPLLTMTLNIDGTVQITNEAGELLTQLVKLFTDIQTGLVTTLLGPQPLVMPTFAVDLAVLETFTS